MVKPLRKVECSRMAASGEEGHMDLCELFFQWISHGTYPQNISIADFWFPFRDHPGLSSNLKSGAFLAM